MTETEWIDSPTACALLGVRPQTLYAYVSRGLLRAQGDSGDARRSLYAKADVTELARRNRRPRARASVAMQAIRWGDPVLETAISDITAGVLRFGDRAAVDCALTMTLEEIAAHHLRLDDTPPPLPPAARATIPPGETALQRGLACLAGLAASNPAMAGLDRRRLATEGGALLAVLADALLGQAAAGPVHLRAARVWGASPTAAAQIRRALVLLSDHELNPSTFAVRVCASTGASLAASLLAGLATLSGPRHGGASRNSRAALTAAMQGPAAIDAFLAADPPASPYALGFGHPLYPDGDPRAQLLLAGEDPETPVLQAVRALSRRFDRAPNIDAALAVLGLNHALPEEAGFTLFALGRCTGWMAHAIEQVESGQIIRPRATRPPLP